MREITAKAGQELFIGKRGENNAVCVVFDISDWQALYGAGNVQLIHQRNGDKIPYPCPVEVSGGAALWVITKTDVANPGVGRAELQYWVGDAIVKSEIFSTKTARSMGNAGEEPPEPATTWLEQMQRIGVETEENAEIAEESAKSAVASVASVASSEANAAASARDAAASVAAIGESEKNAKASAESAAQSAGRAEAAQNGMDAYKTAAETAARSASDSASAAAQSAAEVKNSENNAATSANAAAVSAQSASVSQNAASSSASASAASASVAAQSATKAAASEKNAAQSESSAASSATAADASAKSAAASATTAISKASEASASASSASTSAGSAATSAQNAAQSENNAAGSAQSAASSAENANAAKAGLEAAESNAAASAQAAKASEDNAKASETAAKAAQAAAEAARDDAQGIVGGDFASTAYVDSKATAAESNANAYTDEKVAGITVPVQSVNGKAGAVQLAAADVGAPTVVEAQGYANAAENNANNYTDQKIAAIPAPENNLFVAEYGKTTCAEMEAAYQAGKTIVAVDKSWGLTWYGSGYRNSETDWVFSAAGHSTWQQYDYVQTARCLEDNWSMIYTAPFYASEFEASDWYGSPNATKITDSSVTISKANDSGVKENTIDVTAYGIAIADYTTGAYVSIWPGNIILNQDNDSWSQIYQEGDRIAVAKSPLGFTSYLATDETVNAAIAASSPIFWAIVNETTVEEVSAAIDRGQMVVAKEVVDTGEYTAVTNYYLVSYAKELHMYSFVSINTRWAQLDADGWETGQ